MDTGGYKDITCNSHEVHFGVVMWIDAFPYNLSGLCTRALKKVVISPEISDNSLVKSSWFRGRTDNDALVLCLDKLKNEILHFYLVW